MTAPKRMSDESVQKATGKSWAEWLAILDEERADQLDHPAIARLLAEKYAVSDWWSQMVTVTYERERKGRQLGQRPDGYEMSISKTYPVSLEELYGWWAEDTKRLRWLDTARLTLHYRSLNKTVRMSWDGQKTVAVGFFAKGAGKTQVALSQSKLPSHRAVEQQKAFWHAAFDRLADKMHG